MHKTRTANTWVEKRLRKYIRLRPSITAQLDRLRGNPKKALGDHPVRGRLAGKWSCWLGSNIRAVYRIDDVRKQVIIEAVGSHKVY